MQKASVYKGIEYIRVCELPADERDQIENWLNQDVVIKIQTKERLLSDCIQYKDYSYWFEKIYTKISPAEEEVKELQKPKSKPVGGLAFD